MAKNCQVCDSALNVQADALSALLDGGYLRIYGGKQPKNAGTPIKGQPLLAELRFDSPAASAAAYGAFECESIADEDDAKATGQATWYRCFQKDGRSTVLDGSVGRMDANLIMDDPEIVLGGRVSVSKFVHVMSGATPGH